MITSMHIENFKCFKNFDIDLDPFTVLIGPNDSGKTAFLQAIRICGHLRAGASDWGGVAHITGLQSYVSLVWRNQNKLPMRFRCVGETPADPPGRGPVEASVSCDERRLQNNLEGERRFAEVWQRTYPQTASFREAAMRFLLGQVAFYRFAPFDLRKPSDLGRPLSETGEGFPSFLDSLLRESRESFFKLENAFYERFPHTLVQDNPGTA